jgi:hypothetical protein
MIAIWLLAIYKQTVSRVRSLRSSASAWPRDPEGTAEPFACIGKSAGHHE